MVRVLVIEDEEMIRLTLKQVLERAGHQVELTSNGKEGLARLDSKPTDIVITDIIMPEMDGVEATIQIRAKHPRIKIVAISGGGRVRNLSFLEHAKKMGADVVLPKPFTKDELLGAIATALEA